MEKLLELLNEYDSWWDYDEYYWPYQYWQDRDAYIYGKYYLVSRDYWFIKWLVENDKIDRPKVWLKIKDLWKDYWWFAIYSWIHIECLIMLLSISDTPIEDLVSYLE